MLVCPVCIDQYGLNVNVPFSVQPQQLRSQPGKHAGHGLVCPLGLPAHSFVGIFLGTLVTCPVQSSESLVELGKAAVCSNQLMSDPGVHRINDDTKVHNCVSIVASYYSIPVVAVVTTEEVPKNGFLSLPYGSRFWRDDAHGKKITRSRLDMISTIYEIENIVGKRVSTEGVTEVLVQWKYGYDPSWMPPEHAGLGQAEVDGLPFAHEQEAQV
ncbi:hypothetical protein J8273_6916 [Carpediemonas membranifera]|uniref:Chromo domain-containing protein n=1 Tax=Carpediemonas membranifera TaxID=201153 RepID=A0A8J6AUE2_9EUKA|nr:hypothetical protein J8273_6916 [Carpediemonas membranifera]|eukprot:KAG9391815.1 hypothetical protein J8273_6916 [Carpediemonas membranifera]